MVKKGQSRDPFTMSPGYLQAELCVIEDIMHAGKKEAGLFPAYGMLAVQLAAGTVRFARHHDKTYHTMEFLMRELLNAFHNREYRYLLSEESYAGSRVHINSTLPPKNNN